jgi:calcium permeable stress-gated cation channel
MPFTAIELISSRCKAVVDYLPMSLFTKALAKKYHDHDPDPAHEMNMELFSKDRTCCFLPTCALGSLSFQGVQSIVHPKLRRRNPSYRRGRSMSYSDRAKPQRTEAELRAEKEQREEERAKAEEAKHKQAAEATETAAAIVSPTVNKEASASKTSLNSKHTGKSSKKGGTSKLLEALAEAQPEGLKIDAPAKALVDENIDSDVEDDFEEHAFDHPSTYVQQRMIWIPKWDAHQELSTELVKEIEGRGVAASDLGATIDEVGNVNVTRGPPDEDWSGGHDT